MKKKQNAVKKASTKRLLDTIKPGTGSRKAKADAAAAEYVRRAKTAAKKAERKAK